MKPSQRERERKLPVKRDKEEMKETERRDTLWRLPTDSITESEPISAEARLSYLVSVEISISSPSP